MSPARIPGGLTFGSLLGSARAAASPERCGPPATYRPSGVARRPHTARAAGCLHHPCALPQRDRPARPSLDRSPVGRQRDLIVLDASNVLDDALAVGGPHVDPRRKYIRVTAIALSPNPLRLSFSCCSPRTTGHRTAMTNHDAGGLVATNMCSRLRRSRYLR